MTQWQPPTEPWHPRPVDADEPRPPVDINSGFPPSSPPALLKVRVAVSWSAIILCTLALILLQLLSMTEMRDQIDEDLRPGFEANYQARYAVGYDQIFPGSGQSLLHEFDQAFDESSHPNENRIRSAMLAGEIGSADDVNHRLQLLQDEDLGLEGDNLADVAMIDRIYTQGYLPTDAESQGLIDRHGWFGKLAATHNLHKHDADRMALRQSGKNVVIGLIGIFGVVVLAAILGLVLLIVLIVLLCLKSLRIRGPNGPASHATAYLEIVAMFLVFFIALQIVFGLLQIFVDVDLTLIVLILAPIPLVWPLVLRVPWKRFKEDMGFHTGNGLFRELGAGFLGYLAGLPIIAIGMGLTFQLGAKSGGESDHPLQYEIMEGGLFTIVILIGSAVIWAPLVEESIFRAAFYRHLRQWRGVPGWLIATVISSFVFAAIHPQGYVGIPALMSIAFVLAGLREWRGSIIPCMVAHALHNGALMVMLGIILYA